MNTIHVVDDDQAILESLESVLVKNGYAVTKADTPEKFFKQIEKQAPTVVILDIFFGEGRQSGDEIVSELIKQFPETQCIVISGESDVQKALACLKNGALDFIEKPVSLPRLLTSVKNATNIYNVKNSALSQHKILGTSGAMKKVLKRIKMISSLSESVLICGENGTGKELVAENLHIFSQRYTLPLYKVNCTALNANLIESELFGHKAGSFTGAGTNKKGYFEIADKSSLFIDEIGDFDVSLQSKILRVLQEKKITPVGSTSEITTDVRLIFATHRELETMISENSFREDLYFRISTFTITIPPLRERLEDIDILALHFLTEFITDNKLTPKQFSSNAIDKLKEYTYPGNIRELAKIIKNAAFFCEGDTISAEDIDFNPRTAKNDIWFETRSMSLSEAKEFLEREFILKRLAQMGNDIHKTAESLGIIKNNLYRKLKSFNIDYRF